MRSSAPQVGGEIGGWHCTALRGEQKGVSWKAWGSPPDNKGTSACRVDAGRSWAVFGELDSLGGAQRRAAWGQCSLGSDAGRGGDGVISAETADAARDEERVGGGRGSRSAFRRCIWSGDQNPPKRWRAGGLGRASAPHCRNGPYRRIGEGLMSRNLQAPQTHHALDSCNSASSETTTNTHAAPRRKTRIQKCSLPGNAGRRGGLSALWRSFSVWHA